MRKFIGIIVSQKMQKTRVVEVATLKRHPRYHKYYKASKRFKAHDEKDEYRMGDTVLIEETRPMSRDKRWRIVGKVVRSGRPQDDNSATYKIETIPPETA